MFKELDYGFGWLHLDWSRVPNFFAICMILLYSDLLIQHVVGKPPQQTWILRLCQLVLRIHCLPLPCDCCSFVWDGFLGVKDYSNDLHYEHINLGTPNIFFVNYALHLLKNVWLIMNYYKRHVSISSLFFFYPDKIQNRSAANCSLQSHQEYS